MIAIVLPMSKMECRRSMSPRSICSSLIYLATALTSSHMPAFSQERVLLDNILNNTATLVGGTVLSSMSLFKYNERGKALRFTTGDQGFQLTQLDVTLGRTVNSLQDSLDWNDFLINGSDFTGDNSLPWKFSIGLWSQASSGTSPSASLLASQSVEIFLNLRSNNIYFDVYNIPLSAPGFILNPLRSYAIGLIGMQQPGDDPLVTRGLNWMRPALGSAPLGYEGITFDGAWFLNPYITNEWTSSTSFNTMRLQGVPLEAPGSSPGNPLLPAPPSSANSTWFFPPVTITNPDDVLWFDPEVAIGYIFNVSDLNGPLFDQFISPDLPFNDTYELFGSSSSSCSVDPNDYNSPIATVTQGIAHDFTTPLPCFVVKGIDPANALDPLNTQAFISGISFNKIGSVSVTQTPIPTTVPTPGPLSLLGVAAMFHRARVFRGRVRSAKRISNQEPLQ
jgi:hypothetical protein